MNETDTMNIQQQPTTPTPEEATQAAGGQGSGRMFTQDEVNRIVSDRLARAKAQAEQQAQTDEREQALKVREARLSCREFVGENGYPAALLEVLDTSDFERFKSAVEKLDGAVRLPSNRRAPAPQIVAPSSRSGGGYDPIAAAFKPKI